MQSRQSSYSESPAEASRAAQQQQQRGSRLLRGAAASGSFRLASGLSISGAGGMLSRFMLQRGAGKGSRAADGQTPRWGPVHASRLSR